MTLAENLQVQRQHQRTAAGVFGAIDQATDEVSIFHYVELKPEGLAGVFSNIFD